MTDKELLLTITAEECGELTRACCKILRHGTNEKRLTNLMEEAGDVLCLIDLLIENGYLKKREIQTRIKVKKTKMKKRHENLKNLIK